MAAHTIAPRTLVALISSVMVAACAGESLSQDLPRLRLEQTIELGPVKGRIDHLAIDLTGNRLFVAELENGSVSAVDLATGAVAHRISGLAEPQGVGFLPDRNELVVASGDGTVRFYDGGDLTVRGEIDLGEDADNVRIDPADGTIIVGYGGGALAVIDPNSRALLRTIALPSHPESFRLDPAKRRAFVNLPGAGKLAVVDLATVQISAMRGAGYAANYPLLFDASSNAVMVVYRLPARMVISDADSGVVRQDLGVCGDSDDLFLDDKRQRIYVSCGSGDIDVFEAADGVFKRVSRVKTRSGARTSLFVPEIDRLFVAARADNGRPAAILVYRPE
jgi:YVTN family beta-propeller protein